MEIDIKLKRFSMLFFILFKIRLSMLDKENIKLCFLFFRFRHHKKMLAAAAASTAPTSQNTSFASTESYPYESFDETG
jgi:hypothetical protein